MSIPLTTADIETMLYVRNTIAPQGIANPTKLFPTPQTCGEAAQGYKMRDVRTLDGSEVDRF